MMQSRIYDLPSLMVLGTFTIFFTLLVGWWHHKRRRHASLPRKWRYVGKLSELTLFPLKSCAGITLNEAECTEYGIQTVGGNSLKLRDRFFIVYDEYTGEFKTARTYPKMVLIKMTPNGDDAVKLSAPNMSELLVKVPDGSERNKYSHCKMWEGEMVGLVDCGDAAAKWLAKCIKNKENGVRLGYHLADIMPRRIADKKLKQYFKTLRNRDLGAFSDLASFMLMTESSIDDLKTRIPSHVSIVPKQFRPNFLVQGTEPYEEDKWDWVRIGETAVFRNCKPCTRCVFTTIDPDTGILEPKREPLRTLKGYRQLTDPAAVKLEGSAPVLGINMGLYQNGIVKVGDPVYVGDR